MGEDWGEVLRKRPVETLFRFSGQSVHQIIKEVELAGEFVRHLLL